MSDYLPLGSRINKHFSNLHGLVDYVARNAHLFLSDADLQLEEVDESPPKKNRCRLEGDPIDFSKTAWGRMIRDPAVADPDSRTGKDFHRRFRIPWPIFNEVLLPLVDEHNIFDVQMYSRSRIPVEIKVLVALRILGRGNCADDISEMSAIGLLCKLCE